MNVIVKKISCSDLTTVVDIHAKSLPDDVLPSLGLNVLKKYYERITKNKDQIIFGAFLENQLLGFCLISKKPASFFQAVFNLDGLIGLCRLALLQPKKLFLGFKQALRKETIDQDTAEIAFIAVSPENQGRSIGRQLIRYGVQWCFDNGIKYLQTKTANELLLEYYVRDQSAQIFSSYDLCGRRYSEVKWEALPKCKKACPD